MSNDGWIPVTQRMPEPSADGGIFMVTVVGQNHDRSPARIVVCNVWFLGGDEWMEIQYDSEGTWVKVRAERRRVDDSAAISR